MITLDAGSGSPERGLDREREVIAVLRANGARLTNLTDGGEGCLGMVLSPESRAKLSAAQRGRKHSPEHVANQAAALRGKKHSPERRAAISAALRSSEAKKAASAKRRVLTDQQVADIRATYTGREGQIVALARTIGVAAPTVERALDPNRIRIEGGVVGRVLSIEVHDRAAKKGPSPSTVERVRAIRERYALGQDLRIVAADLGLSLAHVRQVAYRAKFRDVA